MDKHYHLIGIGGIGMSGIARLLLHEGVQVSGSDQKESKITGDLRRLGARICIGHDAANIRDAGTVIYSSAIKEDNPEIVQAKKFGLPLIKRAQALARLMEEKVVITVSGSHGKTTTTSLISYLLLEAGLSPSAAIGGILRNIDSNAHLGDGKFFVAEADESDGSFLYYHPRYSIITNVDREHLDYYKDFEKEVDAFREFINQTEEGGCVFYCADDPNLKKIMRGYPDKSVTFGLREDADIYPKNIVMDGLSSEFDCFFRSKHVSRFQLSLGGMHNISNALSVIALGLELGIDLTVIKKTLKAYKGAKRRLEVKLDEAGISLIDDYAHHPTEIMATLDAANNLKHKRLVAIFQPHRYSRTKLLLNEFARSFNCADYVIITDIYPAAELPIEGISGRCIYDKIKEYAPQKVAVFLPKEEIIPHALKIKRPGDIIITLGAGDIVKICDDLAEEFKK